jgi:hypothetical protein
MVEFFSLWRVAGMGGPAAANGTRTNDTRTGGVPTSGGWPKGQA